MVFPSTSNCTVLADIRWTLDSGGIGRRFKAETIEILSVESRSKTRLHVPRVGLKPCKPLVMEFRELPHVECKSQPIQVLLVSKDFKIRHGDCW